MYSRVNPIKLFDITLRDGLQYISKKYSLKEKQVIFNKIATNYRPNSIEIGSIDNPKIVPQMDNSLELFKYANDFKSVIDNSIDIYMLTPNNKSLQKAINNNVKNFSFITSVSNEFQEININKSLSETKSEIEKMVNSVIIIDNYKIKLYISCISECPIRGHINLQNIIDEILFYYYSYENINNFCLSDTCGSLKFIEFKFILDELIKRNVDITKISLHLHKQKDNQNINNIIRYAILNNITNFDVSSIPNLASSKKNITSNLYYDTICHSKSSIYSDKSSTL